MNKAVSAARGYHKERLKSIGAQDTSLKKLEKYYEAKYNKDDEYKLLMGYNEVVKKGDISPLVGFDTYMKIADEIQKKIVGITTVNGIQIEGFKTHFVDRVIGQVSDTHKKRRKGVSIDDSLDVLLHPETIGAIQNTSNGRSQIFIGKNVVVTVNPDTKNLIQTNPIHSKKEKRKKNDNN